jgi:hypothetical protein
VYVERLDASSQKPFLPETYKRINNWSDFSIPQKIKIHGFWHTLSPDVKEIYIRSCVAKQSQAGNLILPSSTNSSQPPTAASFVVGPSGPVAAVNTTIPDWNIDDYARLIHMVADNKLTADWNEIVQVFVHCCNLFFYLTYVLATAKIKSCTG